MLRAGNTNAPKRHGRDFSEHGVKTCCGNETGRGKRDGRRETVPIGNMIDFNDTSRCAFDGFKPQTPLKPAVFGRGCSKPVDSRPLESEPMRSQLCRSGRLRSRNRSIRPMDRMSQCAQGGGPMTSRTMTNRNTQTARTQCVVGGTLMAAGVCLAAAAFILLGEHSLDASTTTTRPARSLDAFRTTETVPRALPEAALYGRELSLPQVSTADYVVSATELNEPAILLVEAADNTLVAQQSQESVWLTGQVLSAEPARTQPAGQMR